MFAFLCEHALNKGVGVNYYLKNNIKIIKNKNKIVFYLKEKGQIIHCPASFQEFAFLYYKDKYQDADEFANDYQKKFKMDSVEYTKYYNHIKRKFSQLLTSNKNLNVLENYNIKDYLIKTPKSKDLDYKLDFPISYVFQLTTACYTDCIYCYADRNLNIQLNCDKLLKFTKTTLDNNGKMYFLSGGDPLCYKFEYIIKLIKLIRSYPDTVVYLSTKYPNITIDMIKTLKNSGLELIQFSLDSSTPRIIEKYVRVSDGKQYYDRIISTIKICQENDIDVRINTVVSDINIHSIQMFLDDILKLPIKRVELVPYAKSLFHKNKVVYDDVVEEKLAEFEVNYKDEKRVGVLLDKNLCGDNFYKTSCGAGLSTMSVFADGNVGYCDVVGNKKELTVGNIYNDSLEKLWEKLDLKKLFPYGKVSSNCKYCDLFQTCFYDKNLRCLANVLRNSKNVCAIDPYCPRKI
jgi:radical SAM protein with 4Fe4S-binding SPASM domain